MANKTTKRKIIDLKDETFKQLSYMAIDAGQNLKNFIEGKLDEIAEKAIEKQKKAK